MGTELTQDEARGSEAEKDCEPHVDTFSERGRMTKKYRAEITNHRLRGQNGPITRFHLAGTGFVTFFMRNYFPSFKN